MPWSWRRPLWSACPVVEAPPAAMHTAFRGSGNLAHQGRLALTQRASSPLARGWLRWCQAVSTSNRPAWSMPVLSVAPGGDAQRRNSRWAQARVGRRSSTLGVPPLADLAGEAGRGQRGDAAQPGGALDDGSPRLIRGLSGDRRTERLAASTHAHDRRETRRVGEPQAALRELLRGEPALVSLRSGARLRGGSSCAGAAWSSGGGHSSGRRPRPRERAPGRGQPPRPAWTGAPR